MKKKTVLSVVVFIDALGWEVLRDRPFMEKELPYRRKLKSVFGYSSACIPSILTGLMPREHKHWSFFYYSPKTSPFGPLRWLGLLPASIVNRGRVRNAISQLVKKFYKYSGYFQLYNIPFKFIHLFDYCEKSDLFVPGGMNRGKNIFDHLQAASVKYHVSNWRNSEESNLAAARDDIEKGQITFAFLYMASMDALLHNVGKESSQVTDKLKWYEEKLRTLMSVANEKYDEVRLFVCSDHGMATVYKNLNLMGEVEALGLVFGKDYVATYDSTMGRFWFHNAQAKQKIVDFLTSFKGGKILSNEELKRVGCDFEESQYGELIYLMDPGVMIVPSHMGEQPITGMHGYHPDDADSDAVLLSNVEPPASPDCITDIFRLIRSETGA